MTLAYQNIYTRVQVHGPDDLGVALPKEDDKRKPSIRHVYWFGKLGDAQLGPNYLGIFGTVSLICGFIAFEIIGFNMLASVNYSPIEFMRRLFYLTLDPPPAKYGLRIPPMQEGGWWLLAGFFLTMTVMLWWVRMYRRARALNMGTHVAWGFAAAI